ncbi:MAG: hypothetical protein ACE5GC_07995 [Acidimicrobiia bacterium]
MTSDFRHDDGLDPAAVKASLLELADKRGALAAHVGDPALLDDAPEGMRPRDLLAETRAMIVLGGSPPRSGEWHSPRPELMETVGTADRMNVLGNSIAKHIETEYGYYALNVPTATDKDNRPFLDFKAAAVAAGLGSYSLAGPVLHPDHGMLYLAVILTSLPLPADGEPATPVCPAPSCADMWEEQATTPCMSTCSIDGDGCLGGTLEDGAIGDRSYDASRCEHRVYHYWVPGYQAALAQALDEPDPDVRKMILYGSFFTRTMWSITYSNVSQGQCFECMRVCPVGAERRALR